MACGAGLLLLAFFVTGVHFVVVYGYSLVTRRMLSEQIEIHVHYIPGTGAMEKVMQTCTRHSYSLREINFEQTSGGDDAVRTIHLQLSGRSNIESLLIAISDTEGVTSTAFSPLQTDKE